jgi:hypothetical protein
MWADLLALAGDSRFPGIVTPGEDGQGKFIGYPPSYFAGLFRCSEGKVIEAFELFEQQSRIHRGDGGEIHIVNWEKYQSEYQEKRRRKQYKQKSAQVTANVRQNSAAVESEGEGEVEEEAEVDKSFRAWWDLYPRKVGKEKALKAWSKLGPEERESARRGLQLWKQTEQWISDGGKFIPYASTFLTQKRYLDEPWTNAFEELHEKP